MKIAIISDIHGNLPALQKVMEDLNDWQPDHVIVAGDIVNRGPTPLECLEIVQEKEETADWRIVKGNHEDYVLVHTKPDAPRSGHEFEFLRSTYWTYQQLNGHIPYLEAMPFQREIIGPDGRIVRAVHASMKANNVGVYDSTTDEELREIITPAPTLLAVGHTHRPLIREVDETIVVNAGSVGLPFDGDRRASYARLTWDTDDRRWQPRIVRLDYDWKTAENDYFDTNYMEEAGPLAELMLREFRRAEGHLHRWGEKYVPDVLSGDITMRQSVDWYMAEMGLK
jgi:predicted phosphodiesterase